MLVAAFLTTWLLFHCWPQGSLDSVEELVTCGELRVVGLVVDTVDRIMHGMELGSAGMLAQVRQWSEDGYMAELLGLLLRHGFTPLIISDHGNVEAEGAGHLAAVETAG